MMATTMNNVRKPGDEKNDELQYSTVQYGILYYMVRYGMVWYGMV
jgi:hypothetical protein